MTSRPAVAILLLAFALPGCTNIDRADPPLVEATQLDESPLRVRFAHETRNTTHGQNVTFALEIASTRDLASSTQGLDVRAELLHGAQALASTTATLRAGETTVVFLTLAVPQAHDHGGMQLNLRIATLQDELLLDQPDAVRLYVIHPGGRGLTAGEDARFVYTARFAGTDTVFSTNDERLSGLAYSKAPNASYTPSIFTLRAAPQNAIPGFYQASLGMSPGETRTTTFGPELAYGPKVTNTVYPRFETLPRTVVFANPETNLSLEVLTDYLQRIGHPQARSLELGTTFPFSQNGVNNTARITNVTSTMVGYVLDFHEGDTGTLYPAWPNASVVTSTADGQVIYRTTPPNTPGDAFTYSPVWPNMTTLESVNDTQIVLRHDPPEGFSWTIDEGGASRTIRITGITDKEIELEGTSHHPLAGRTLTFDITLTDILT